MNTVFKRILVLGLGVGMAAMSSLAGAAAPDPAQNENWLRVKKMLFGDREVRDNAQDVVRLWIAKRAEDASVVPLLVRTGGAQTPEKYIKKMWIIIDNNPSPVGIRFTLTPDSGRGDIETRVRIEGYTPVRAVAEMNDGTLWMDTRTINASGGCSAPIRQPFDESVMGKMKFRLERNINPNEPTLAQLMIRHPNTSGLSSQDISPHFVRQVKVFYGDTLVMTADVDFTISENPNFRFYFVPKGDGELRAEVIDTADVQFEKRASVELVKQ